MQLSDVDAIAATCGPGLIGGVIVGMMAGKTMASMLGKPFIGVNHLEGHILSSRLTDNVSFPYLVLLVSGAHTQILIAHDLGNYELLGTTLDDAVGECFDKVGRMLGLPFPGGKYVAKLAAQCTDRKAAKLKYMLPRPLKGREGCDFSFSGLKTAVLNLVQKQENITDVFKQELSYELEESISEVLLKKTKRAITEYGVKSLVIGGGVSANSHLREKFKELCKQEDVTLFLPDRKYTGDNGVMIGIAGYRRFVNKKHDPDVDRVSGRLSLED